MHIGWPQGIWIGLVALRLTLAAALHGKPMTGNYNFALYFNNALITAALLYWGGFFS